MFLVRTLAASYMRAAARPGARRLFSVCIIGRPRRLGQGFRPALRCLVMTSLPLPSLPMRCRLPYGPGRPQ